jgi:preprotein translocase subunit Sec63
MIDFSKYKTYDTTNGFGNPDEWKTNFNQRMKNEDAELILKERDPYLILGVSRNDTLQFIKKVFRKLALANHPDRGGSTVIMQELNAAYSIICNSFD